MWKNGRTPIIVSVSRMSITALVCTTLATRLRCVSCTTFGKPVVPDDIGIATTASAGILRDGRGLRGIAQQVPRTATFPRRVAQDEDLLDIGRVGPPGGHGRGTAAR